MERGKYVRDFGKGTCSYCRQEFTLKMPGQRFCKAVCRQRHHEGNGRALEVLNELRTTIDQKLAELST